MRLDGFFSSQGILTRREARKEIKENKVKVNDICINDYSYNIKDTDVIKYNDEIISFEKYVYYILNKPSGYVCAREDNISKTVLELIDDNRKDLSPVGRLDKDTTGLLIITNDGILNHELTSPRKHLAKKYYADIDGIVTNEDVIKFKKGLDIGDETNALPAILKIISIDEKNNTSKIEVEIREGRYHEVKRLFEAVNKKVLSLKRISIGNLILCSGFNEGKYIKISKEKLIDMIYD